ncbi:ABC transporter ATP-binding protein [Pimelobacter simplex]|uniref:ABC transporter ATP-binding protein n=1 Tax=Nocardioides simplex TaxID=2045 RepID=UPI003AB0BEB3
MSAPAATGPLLQVAGLVAGYGASQVLHGLDLTVGAGEMVAVLGANGAGKTTLLGALSGTVRSTGAITFQGRRIEALATSRRAALGLGHCPQGRGTFVDLTVEENLRIGGLGRRTDEVATAMETWFEAFPILRERRRQPAGHLSGGEQQMLAIARTLMTGPALLMLDEPSLGLSPRLTAQVIEDLRRVTTSTGTALLLIEQNVGQALRIADRAYVLQSGAFVAEGDAATLADDDIVRRAYLGV